MLRDKCEAVVNAIFPNAVKAGGFLQVDDLYGTAGDNLKVQTRGAKRGTWVDYGTTASDPRGTGDMLKLVQLTIGEGDMGRALAWARGFLGLDTMDPQYFARYRLQAEKAAARRERDKAKDDEAKRARAEGHWISASPLTPSSPVVKYLAGRGIDLAMLGRMPGAIRFHHKMFHPELSEQRGTQVLLPAMVTKFNGPAGGHAATHVTFLHLDRASSANPGGWVKLPKVAVDKADPETGELTTRMLDCTKKIYGPTFVGGHMALWKGECPAPLWAIAPGTPVHVSEGIEDGLSYALANPHARVIAAGTLGNIAALELPKQAGDLVLLAQNDTKAKPIEALVSAIEAQQAKAREHSRAQGSLRRVLVKRPPQGIKDWNDWLQAPVAGDR